MHTFTRLDNTVFEHVGTIGPLGLAIYAALCKRADNRTRQCFPSYETLARDAGVCRTVAKRKARQLAELGLIRIEPRQDAETGQWTSPLFTVLDNILPSPSGRGARGEGRQEGQVSDTPPPRVPDAPITKPSLIELNPTTTAAPEALPEPVEAVETPRQDVVVVEQEKTSLKLPQGVSEALANKALAHVSAPEEKQAILDTVAQAGRIETTPARYLFGVLKHWDSALWQAEHAEQQEAQRRREQTRQATATRLAAIQAVNERRLLESAPAVDLAPFRAGAKTLREVLRL